MTIATQSSIQSPALALLASMPLKMDRGLNIHHIDIIFLRDPTITVFISV